MIRRSLIPIVYRFICLIREVKSGFLTGLKQKYEFFSENLLQLKNKVLLLHYQNNSELWCNGNTTDSGPVILGSNPGSSTKKPLIFQRFFLFLSYPVRSGSRCRNGSSWSSASFWWMRSRGGILRYRSRSHRWQSPCTWQIPNVPRHRPRSLSRQWRRRS